MQEKRTHYRVPIKKINETPANGVFLTREELHKYGIFAGLLLIVLTFFAVFGRKH